MKGEGDMFQPGSLRVVWGLNTDNGKEHGNYYIKIGYILGFNMGVIYG